MFEKKKTLKYLFINALILVFIGNLMVYSASYISAKEVFGNSNHFFYRQLGFTFLGMLFVYLISNIKSSFWYRYHFWISLFFSTVLILTLVPGIGVNSKGAHRWLNLGGMGFQPGEFVKYAQLPLCIFFFENFGEMSTKKRFIYAANILLPLLIFIMQPDFGSFTICFMVICFICFLSSFPRKYFYSFISVGMVCCIVGLFMAPYRVQRVMTYLDPWKDPKRTGFQIIQSYLAFAQGHLWGKGIGNGHEKLFYLPEAHNDFIFSVIGEEMGFVGVAIIILLFLTFIYFGFSLALQYRDRVFSMMVVSMTFAVGIQAFLNMGVVLGILPTKGLNLPFISYGGSSMLANALALGLIYSFTKNEQRLN